MKLHTKPTGRLGLAALEFAMALPILLIAFAVIISTAYVGLGRLRAGVSAGLAWKEKEEKKTGKPLFFFPNDTPLAVTKKQDVIILLRRQKVETKSTIAILAGSWDHRDVNPGGSKMIETTGLMVLSMGASVAGGVDYILKQLGDLGSLSGLAGSMIADSANANKDIEAKTAEKKKEIEKMKKQVNDDLDKARKELEAANKELDAANKDLTSARDKKRTDEDRKTKLEKDRVAANDTAKKVQDDPKATAAQKKQAQEKAAADVKSIDAQIKTVEQQIQADGQAITAKETVVRDKEAKVREKQKKVDEKKTLADLSNRAE